MLHAVKCLWNFIGNVIIACLCFDQFNNSHDNKSNIRFQFRFAVNWSRINYVIKLFIMCGLIRRVRQEKDELEKVWKINSIELIQLEKSG